MLLLKTVLFLFQLRNRGPSTFSKAMLDIEWPYRFNNGSLLYITKLEVDGDGGMNCSTDMEINPLNVSNPLSAEKNITSPSGGGGRDRTEGRNRNHVHRRELERKEMEGDLETLAESQNRSFTVRSSASFSVIEMPYNKNLLSELPSNTTTVSMSVIWVKSDPEPVPWWVVALALIAGLLLLAVLIFIMYKLGFFERVRPPQEDSTEKEQLAPQENGDRNTDA
uniref:Integrin alpha third immunoglobulin-like domain-containing protein n=1 Tax=Hucho hucho TaxID=62062 RepID=A0A4W5K5R8_9TELE